MTEFDFSSEIPDSLPITKRVVETARAASAANRGIEGFKVPGIIMLELARAVAALEERLNALEAGDSTD